MSEGKGKKEDEGKNKRNPFDTHPRHPTTSRRKSSTTEGTPASVRKKERPIKSVGSSPEQADPNSVKVLGLGNYQTAPVSKTFVPKDYQERSLGKNSVLQEIGIPKSRLENAPHHISSSRSRSGELTTETLRKSEAFTVSACGSNKWNALFCVQCSAVYNESDRLPRSLICGHTICEACLRILVKKAPRCPVCQGDFKTIKNVQDSKINHIILKLLACVNKTGPEFKENTQEIKIEYESRMLSSIGASMDTRNVLGSFNEECLKRTVSENPSQRVYTRNVWLCVQCFQTFSTDDQSPAQLKCSHKLCDACFQSLMQKNPRCPKCFTQFDKDSMSGHSKINPKPFALKSRMEENRPEEETQMDVGVIQTQMSDSSRKTAVTKGNLSDTSSVDDSAVGAYRRTRTVCSECFTSYDHSSHLPRMLSCGHTLCTSCLKSLMKGAAKCPLCHAEFREISAVENVVINHTVLADISLNSILNKTKESVQLKKIAGKTELPSSSRNVLETEYDRGQSASKELHQKEFKRNAMMCAECKRFYDHYTRLPRILPCGDSICTSCLQFLVKFDFSCPTCQESVKNIKHVKDAILNKTLCELIDMRDTPYRSVGEKKLGEDELYPKVSGAEKPVVTAKHTKIHNSHAQYSRANPVDDSLIIPKTSPHKSNCLEMGVSPTSHCASCQKWVCDECVIIDHPQQKGCYLIPKKEALLQMKEAYVNDVRITGESVEDALQALHIYQEHLEVFSTTMQAAFECIGKEKERVKMLTKRGQERKREMEAAVSGFSNVQNLPEALALLQKVEDLSKGTQQWTTTDAAETLDSKRIIETVKGILLSSVYMMKMSDTENSAVLLLVASQKVFDVTLLSRMTVAGKHLFVHCLEKMDTVPKGTRAIPLLSIKACLNSSSPLVFLDIGWNGKVAGRLIIRLMGETFRGRQFLMLCTGEGGPSFRNTHFHRVSRKGCPGEHIWGGDYDNGDGSGGKTFLKVSEKEKLALPAGKSMPITAGLVAGNYVETTPRSLFFIYTKDQIKPNRDLTLYDRESVEMNDHSAFGMVEDGLHILDSAVKQNSITDVIIYSCGIIIDA